MCVYIYVTSMYNIQGKVTWHLYYFNLYYIYNFIINVIDKQIIFMLYYYVVNFV